MRPFLRVFILFIFLLSLPSLGHAVNDGFSAASIEDSQYFQIHFQKGTSHSQLLEKLDFIPDQEWLLNSNFDKNISFAGLTGAIDALFIRVSSILDMYLYTFKGNIKVCQNHDQLKKIFYTLYHNQSIPDTGYSFYVHELKTIYISQDHFTKAVLSHEIAHAVISHYFVVQPSIKVQEVLAGYIEFQIRKSR